MKTHIVAPPSLPVRTGTFKVTPLMRSYIDRVLDSGRISYGELSQAFEKRFSAMHDSPYGVLSNSGTSSLHVALQALKEVHGWQDGDQVIVPATTFVATVNVVLHNRLKPVLVDVERETFGLDPALLEAAISPRTRALIPVHLFGQACRMTEIMRVARKHGLRVIEDSCEAMFVTHAGSKVGSIGDIGCFSLYVAHLLVAGVGGIAATANPDYAAKMRSLVNHGLSIDNLNVDDNFAPRPMLNRRFEFESAGHSFRLTEFEAAVALAQLDDVQQMLATRRRNAAHLAAGVAIINGYTDQAIALTRTLQANTHAHMMFPLVLRRETKVALCAWLNEHQVETRDIPSLLFQPCYHFDPERYPVSKWISESGFYVGCHQAMGPDDCNYVMDRIGDYFHQQLSERAKAEEAKVPA